MVSPVRTGKEPELQVTQLVAMADESYSQKEDARKEIAEAEYVDQETVGMLARNVGLEQEVEQVAGADGRVSKSGKGSGIETGRSNKWRHIFLVALVCCLLAGVFIFLYHYWYLNSTEAVEESVAPVAYRKSRLASTATYSGITQSGVPNVPVVQDYGINQHNDLCLVRYRVGRRWGRGPGGFQIKVQGECGRGVVVRKPLRGF
jgi:hypothetical protein